jgi:hypothetical protein
MDEEAKNSDKCHDLKNNPSYKITANAGNLS